MEMAYNIDKDFEIYLSKNGQQIDLPCLALYLLLGDILLRCRCWMSIGLVPPLGIRLL